MTEELETCSDNTHFSFRKEGKDPVSWIAVAYCRTCGYRGVQREVVSSTTLGFPVVSFSQTAEWHIEHLIWSRDKQKEEV